jgi:hypothetical protein
VRPILGLSTGLDSFVCSLFFLSHHGVSSRVFPGRVTGVTLSIGTDSRVLGVVATVVVEDGFGIGLDRSVIVVPSREGPSALCPLIGIEGVLFPYTGEG